MGYTIRQLEAERNFCQELTVEALQRAVPQEAIAAVVAETGHPVQRARKLTAEATIWTLIAMNLYTHLALGHVLRKLAQGLRFIWPDPRYRVPGASAGPTCWAGCRPTSSRSGSPPCPTARRWPTCAPPPGRAAPQASGCWCA